jgi:hypothetical protein
MRFRHTPVALAIALPQAPDAAAAAPAAMQTRFADAPVALDALLQAKRGTVR